ncbi:RbsD/FucU domain-containing protein [Kineococcus terrestris]|uniref:RbsD/FucU domain-containing protein n=1 Tax=Kineococcus terrestris TaxID=2044856 RepID=UPI0034DACFF7
MLNYRLLHPPLLAALARAGHGDRIVLADGNFPLRTAVRPDVEVVHLNLRPGTVSVPDVLEPLLEAVPVEAATYMGTPDGAVVDAHADYDRLLGPAVPTTVQGDRWKFYDETRGEDVAVVVATADQRLCANLVLTVGVRGGGPG